MILFLESSSFPPSYVIHEKVLTVAYIMNSFQSSGSSQLRNTRDSLFFSKLHFVFYFRPKVILTRWAQAMEHKVPKEEVEGSFDYADSKRLKRLQWRLNRILYGPSLLSIVTDPKYRSKIPNGFDISSHAFVNGHPFEPHPYATASPWSEPLRAWI